MAQAAHHENVSLWKRTAKHTPHGTLRGDADTDVLIVGGGMAGVLCAYMLRRAGVDCLLVEAGEIGGGVTKNTTAKITLGHGLLYGKMIARFGMERARLYVQAQMRACAAYARLCRDVDCDYEVRDSYVYSLKDTRPIEREIDALRRLGVAATFSDASELPFAVAGAVRVGEQAQLHPLKFLYAIAQKLPILEQTKVVELMPHRARTGRGDITFRKLIVATHFPILNKHGLYSLKLYQHRSYVLALRGAPPLRGMYVDASDRGLSFRSFGELLLLGGGAHRTGKRGGGFAELEAFAAEHFRHAEIVGRWATQDCMTLDGLPYIGQYAPATPDVYVATGFNKWGMTNAMVAAELLCGLVQGRPNRACEVFSPSRTVLRPQLAKNVLSSVAGLLTPTVPRCPHLGCALKYNRAEHSWDCSCHGSRFAEDGTLLDNPATDGIRGL